MMKASGAAPEYTHVKLLGGAKGFILLEDEDTVVMEDQTGMHQEYDKCSLHLVWARKDWGHSALRNVNEENENA